MRELDHKEGWVSKNWCFRIMALEKTLEGPLDCQEIKPVNSKGIQPGMIIGRTDAEAPILGHLMWRVDPLEKPLSWEQLRAGGEGNNKGWDGWMASSPPNWWTWVWANSRRWWRTGKPWESQRIKHNWLTNFNCFVCLLKSKSNSVSSH